MCTSVLLKPIACLLVTIRSLANSRLFYEIACRPATARPTDQPTQVGMADDDGGAIGTSKKETEV